MEGKELYKQLDEIQESLTNTVIIDGVEQELKWANDEEKYLKDCCIKAGKELEKHSFKWDGKEKNLVVQALQLNQLYEKLEQENKELKIKLSSTKCYLCGEGFLTPEGTELYEEKEKYKTALIELRKDFNNFRFTIIPFHVGAKEVLPHKLVDVIQDYCIEIENRIYEVLKK